MIIQITYIYFFIIIRYNLVTEEEMKGMQWLDQQEGKSGTIDTYMDTTAKTRTQ